MTTKSKYFIFLFVTVNIFVSAQNYTLVWSDEFAGTSLNTNDWTRETGGGGWGNNELQYYRDGDNNSYIQDGKLVIEAKKENFGGREYTSARLKTQGKQFFRYGKVEARIKLPFGQGIWPAFWMLGESISSIGWPACGEIDVMEMIGGTNNDNVAHGTLHWDDNGHKYQGDHYSLNSGIFADDYHIFTIEWTPNSIRWFVDGNEYYQSDITSETMSEFHEEHFILLNVAVGGNWPGNPNASTQFPQKMYVDYVRVYNNLAAIPVVTISEPTSTSFEPGDVIVINADVNFEGNIKRVDFYQDQVRIGTTEIEPYIMTWENVKPGCYNIKAVAVTSDGFEGKSESMQIKVGANCVEAPYKGWLNLLPGKIEAENFNIGSAGEAYYDTDASNNGGAYRSASQVDIEGCTDVGEGYNIGYTSAGEWLDYDITLDTGGEHIISARVASENGDGKFHIELDGTDITGIISVPNTGGWQEWQTVETTAVLEPGTYTLRVKIDVGSFNLNYFEFYPVNAEPKINLISPDGGESYTKNGIAEVRWSSLMVDNLMIGISTDNGSNWEFITQEVTSEFGIHRWRVPDLVSDECLVMLIDKSNTSLRDTSGNNFSIDEVSSVENELNEVKFTLNQNYPNPFNPSTKISFTIPPSLQSHPVTLKIYDVLGNLVTELIDDSLAPGNYSVDFNAETLPSGIYFANLRFVDHFRVIKLNLLK
ncbi:MAG: hypothetical protein SCALA702_22100 [Melioribacteraceae bacterium]|nr:MAG: hypothetical protein SCALA702_22100 [Melioribacteraceae bacterium]